MPGMLVSLLDLPDERPLCEALLAQGIELARPLPPRQAPGACVAAGKLSLLHLSPNSAKRQTGTSSHG